MIVKPFGYPLENRLIPKLDLMIQRCKDDRQKKDAVLLFEGAEGEGKTTFSIAVAYYVAGELNRKFNEKNVFFDIESMIKFLQSTENQIAIWDEPALSALSTDFASRSVKDLTRLLMMVRKKRHFIMINMTHFNKFNDYIVCDRPLGMLHVYSRRGVQSGRFVYIRKKYLQNLWFDWRFKKKKNYIKYSVKSGKLMGTFPDVLSPKYKHNVLSAFNVDEYEKAKDKAIMQVGKPPEKNNNKQHIQLIELKNKIGRIKPTPKNPILTRTTLAKCIGISLRELERWAKLTPPLIGDTDYRPIKVTEGEREPEDTHNKKPIENEDFDDGI